jgi:isocitrate/isopropylmalate dehydrogenase
MMLDWLDEREAAKNIEEAVIKVLTEGKVLTPDLGGSAKTSEVARAVVARIT